MTGFYDLHCHILHGVDDGAQSASEGHAMLEEAYADGIRHICVTPHYNPYNGMTETDSIPALLDELCAYARDKGMDVSLKRGCEIMYHSDCVQGLEDGTCRTLCDSRYVLVEFPFDCSYIDIKKAVIRLHSHGYIAVVAHVDRYPCMYKDFSDVRELCSLGAVMQFSTRIFYYASFRGLFKDGARHSFSKKALKAQLCGFVASDAHDTKYRRMLLSAAYAKSMKMCGRDYTEYLFFDMPSKIFGE